MSECNQDHEEKETLTVDVIVPGHADRVATPLFHRTRLQLLDRDKRCWISGALNTHTDPLEAHHHPIERSFAEMIDWHRVRRDAEACELGLTGAQRRAAHDFDWDGFMNAVPFDPYTFVDNMLVNGVLLGKSFHIGKDEGIHTLPFPIFVAQRYGRDGYKFSEVEIIHHQEGDA